MYLNVFFSVVQEFTPGLKPFILLRNFLFCSFFVFNAPSCREAPLRQEINNSKQLKEVSETDEIL